VRTNKQFLSSAWQHIVMKSVGILCLGDCYPSVSMATRFKKGFTGKKKKDK